MTARWREYIEKGIKAAGGPVPFALQQWSALSSVFQMIRRTVPPGSKILDVGCGAGIFTALLAQHGYEATGVDNDADIVALAHEMTAYFRSPAQIEQASALDLSRYYGGFALAYSLGVVEHFDRDVTVQLVREQARCAQHVLVAVPTKYTRYTAPITDERLYTRSQIEEIVREAGLHVRDSEVYGEVPTAGARTLSRVLPLPADRWVKRRLTYAMGIAVLGSRDA